MNNEIRLLHFEFVYMFNSYFNKNLFIPTILYAYIYIYVYLYIYIYIYIYMYIDMLAIMII